MKTLLLAVCLLLTLSNLTAQCSVLPDQSDANNIVLYSRDEPGNIDARGKNLYLVFSIIRGDVLADKDTKIFVYMGTSQIDGEIICDDIYQVVPCYLRKVPNVDYQTYLFVSGVMYTSAGEYAGIPGISTVTQFYTCTGPVTLSLKDKEDPRKNTSKPYTFALRDMLFPQLPPQIIVGTYPQLRQKMEIGKPYVWNVGKGSLPVKEMRVQ